MKNTVYVIGHRNPDTDSIASAIAYADLKRRTGLTGAVAAMAGEPNPQTRYILDRLPEEIIEVGAGTAVRYLGNYEDYLRKKAAGDHAAPVPMRGSAAGNGARRATPLPVER